MKKKNKVRVFSIRIEEDMMNELEVIAEETERSIGAVVRLYIKKELNKKKGSYLSNL